MAEILRSVAQLIHTTYAPVALGLLSHLVLNNGEWDHKSHILSSAWATAFAVVATIDYLANPLGQSISGAVAVAGHFFAVYFASLVSSILIYRAFFHRLRKFPGPFSLRLSKWFSLTYVIPDRQYYKVTEGLHKKYASDIIRTGPRELNIIRTDAIPLIHGPTSKCTKGQWYAGSYHIEGASLQTTRSKQDHKERRKVWERAFNARSLRDYEPRVNRHTHLLISKLLEHAHEPSIRISNWVNFFSFDLMGDIGYSRSFHMLEKGEEDKWITLVHKSMGAMTFLNHLPYVMSTATRLGAAKDILDFMAFTSETLRERKKRTPKENDVFGWLLNPADEDIPLQLNADSRLMIVAGSDTTSATLTWIFYELCMDQTLQAKLRSIVDTLAPGKPFLDAEDVANCPYLEGVVLEGLRLHPAVPSGVQRETPPEGLNLPDGTYIPGNVLIWMPMHTIHRDPRNFSSPLTFAPERWMDDAEKENFDKKSPSSGQPYTADKRAFMPFGTGPYNCVGQKLATMEMRTVIANLVRTFEMRFADEEDGSSVLKDTVDCFTLNVGKLDVKLTPRR
ncbi:cytochrome P450 [Westerdykella ornata]|uniref:Cytochrome P450 n=1 Tax=Westerdykella ornata TaxID=318751 RepID=A0A6A6JP33_WESOR|nr:cytochrome P450 [Westerdykella ornata]KAF2278282.1 cytochrome P450 [Westerdykella ornata]